MRALVVLVAFAVFAWGLDQLSKELILANMEVGQTVPVLGEVFQFYLVKNPGAAFSMASGFTWVLSAIAFGVVVFMIIFARRIRSVAWAVMFGLLLGGALGNLTDRLFREPSFGEGHVVDFLRIWGFPAIFNVADVAICTAMGLFVLLTIRGVGLDGTRHASEKEIAAAEAESPASEADAPTPTEAD